MSHLVSILIPAYNAEKWIGETIRSAIGQTWPNKEIIIVNDGSTDSTLAIAKQFESRSLKVISQENSGGCAARNAALAYSQGDYIQWLDSDDLLASNKISFQMREVEKGLSNLTLLSGPYGKFYARPERAKFVRDSMWNDITPVEWILTKFCENLFMILPCWLTSRKLTEIAGKWDERLHLDQDGEYFCRVVAKSERIKFVPDAICYYRQTGLQQKHNDRSERALRSLLLSMKLCIQYLRFLEESERTRRACLMLLQLSLANFYPGKIEMLKEINTLAAELGGELVPPSFPGKYDFMLRLLGWRRSLEVIRTIRKLRLSATVKLDELLYIVTRAAGKVSEL